MQARKEEGLLKDEHFSGCDFWERFNLRTMKIAVLGATGLLGAAVCREVLARGCKPLAFANRTW